jgi:LysM repeat protein
MASVSQPPSNHLSQHRTSAPSTQPTAGTKHALTTAETKGAAPKHVDYTIKKGDTLTSISKAHKTSVDELMKANPQIKDKHTIYAGSVMKVPATETKPETVKAEAATTAAEGCPAKPEVDAKVQAQTRQRAVGREELIRKNLEAMPPRDKGEAVRKQSAVSALNEAHALRQEAAGLRAEAARGLAQVAASPVKGKSEALHEASAERRLQESDSATARADALEGRAAAAATKLSATKSEQAAPAVKGKAEVMHENAARIAAAKAKASAAPTSIADDVYGAAGDRVAEKATQLRSAGLLHGDEYATLSNGVVEDRDFEIQRAVYDRVNDPRQADVLKLDMGLANDLVEARATKNRKDWENL